MPYAPWYFGDFLNSLSVQMMNAEEVGCYCLLLFNLYQNGGKLPNKPEALKVLCRGIAVALPVLANFYVDGEFLRHKRVDKVMRDFSEMSARQSANAKKRWIKDTKEPMPRHESGIAMASERQYQSKSKLKSKESIQGLVNKPCLVSEGSETYNTAKQLCETEGIRFGIPYQYFKKFEMEYDSKNILEGVKSAASYMLSKGNDSLSYANVQRFMRDFPFKARDTVKDDPQKSAAYEAAMSREEHLKTKELQKAIRLKKLNQNEHENITSTSQEPVGN